jgi:hypothetical protein
LLNCPLDFQRDGRENGELKSILPLLVAVYVSATGIFFILASVFNTRIAPAGENGNALLLAISAAFVLAGVYFAFLFFTDRLKRKGKSIIEIRLEAIQKYDSQSILADIVRNETVPEIREAAQRRLEEIAAAKT